MNVSLVIHPDEKLYFGLSLQRKMRKIGLVTDYKIVKNSRSTQQMQENAKLGDKVG